MNNLNLFNYLRRGWWCFIIDNIISECIYLLIRHIFQMVYQSTSSSEYLFFSFPSGFFTCQLLHYATSAYQPHHYSSTSSLPIILGFLLFRALNLLTVLPLFPTLQLFSSYFSLLFLWMLYMLVTTYKTKLILWKTLIIFIA